MRIAVITYSFAQNWGAVLQAYALVEYLNSIGHDAKLIYYREFDNRKFTTIKSVYDGLISVLKWRENQERVDKFNDFRINNLQLTAKCTNEKELSELNQDFDAFITGSDQVWNVGKGVCKDYYLSFAEPEKRRISYAASFGVSSIPEQYQEQVREGINGIQYVSIREKSGAKIVKSLTGKDVKIVLDPVFLKTNHQWNQLVGNERIKKEKYIFVYPTQITKRLEETVKILKKQYGCMAFSPFAIKGCKTIKNIGPKEFVKYIRDSEAVIASSFHATAFSIIYKKPIYVVAHSQTGSRTTDLLESIGMEQSIITDPAIIRTDYDYSIQDMKLLQEKINYSKEFLLHSTSTSN